MPWLPTNWGFRPPGPCVSLCACFASPMDPKGQLQWNSTSVESLMKQKFQWINYVLKHEVSHDLCRVSYILLVTKDVVCFFNCLTKDDKLRSSHIIPHLSYPKSLTVNLDHEDTRPGWCFQKTPEPNFQHNNAISHQESPSWLMAIRNFDSSSKL